MGSHVHGHFLEHPGDTVAARCWVPPPSFPWALGPAAEVLKAAWRVSIGSSLQPVSLVLVLSFSIYHRRMEIKEWHEVCLSVSFNYFKTFAPAPLPLGDWCVKPLCLALGSSSRLREICFYRSWLWRWWLHASVLKPCAQASRLREGPIIELTSCCFNKLLHLPIVRHGSQHWRFRKTWFVLPKISKAGEEHI